MQAITTTITMESPSFSSSYCYCASSADTSTAAKSGLDILLFAAIDVDYESNQKSSSPKSSKSFGSPTSVNPFRSKMDPRMRKSIEAKAMNPVMLDAEAVMVGFNFPKRGNNSDANWMGEGNVSMRQRKINFRRSWQRFHAKQTNKTSSTVEVVPSSNTLPACSLLRAVSSCPEDSSIESTPPEPDDRFSLESGLIDSSFSSPMTLPKKTPSKAFPQTLLSIVSNPEYNHIISWLPTGDAFGIHKQEEFESQILPKYFRHTRFSSFVRKLNRWGFRRMRKIGPRWIDDCGSMVFCHDGFKRDDPNCGLNVSCKPSSLVCKMIMDTSSAGKSMSNSPNFVVPTHVGLTNTASDLVMMQHQAELSRLLLQQQQYLNLLSQRTNRSRALLHGRIV